MAFPCFSLTMNSGCKVSVLIIAVLTKWCKQPGGIEPQLLTDSAAPTIRLSTTAHDSNCYF